MSFNPLGFFEALGGGIVGYFIPFLIVLTIVVFFHELGHFLIARLCGVRVVTFSIGFGPELAGFNDRHGTRWKLAAVPLGGYVKFLGDDSAASTPDSSGLASMTPSERRESFHYQHVAKRAAIVAAGPIANFILAIAIFAGVFAFYGKQIASPRVDTVQPNSAAAAAGLQPGDLVLDIDGTRIESFSDMQRIVGISAGRTLAIKVERGSQEVTLQATPQLQEMKDNFGNVHQVGVLGIGRSMSAADIRTERASIGKAIVMGAEECWFIVDRTASYLVGVIMQREKADQLGGPARIAQFAGQVWQAGYSNGGGFGAAIIGLLSFTAMLSVSIGLLNLFPVPLLDGGHLLFYAIEAIRGRPLSEQVQEMGFRIGLALVLMLMIFATYNDTLHFFKIFSSTG